MPEDTMAPRSALRAWLTASAVVRHLVELLGSVRLVELKVRDVGFARGKLAKHLPTRRVRLARMILIQAIRNAVVKGRTPVALRRRE